MKAKVAVHGISIDVEIECQNEALKQICQARLEASQERIAHAISQAICSELKQIVPGIECNLTAIGEETDWE